MPTTCKSASAEAAKEFLRFDSLGRLGRGLRSFWAKLRPRVPSTTKEVPVYSPWKLETRESRQVVELFHHPSVLQSVPSKRKEGLLITLGSFLFEKKDLALRTTVINGHVSRNPFDYLREAHYQQ